MYLKLLFIPYQLVFQNQHAKNVPETVSKYLVCRVSSCEKYFCEDGLYSPLEELENCKELILVVMTLSFDNLPSDGPDGKALPSNNKELCHTCRSNNSNELKQESEINCENYSITCAKRHSIHKDSHVTCDMQLFISGLLSQLEEPYILDIDMDFFSTLNPFKIMFTEVCRNITHRVCHTSGFR